MLERVIAKGRSVCPYVCHIRNPSETRFSISKQTYILHHMIERCF